MTVKVSQNISGIHILNISLLQADAFNGAPHLVLAGERYVINYGKEGEEYGCKHRGFPECMPL